MAGKVLIVGARGRFGRAALAGFRARGWAIRALARTAPERRLDGLEWIQADARDAAALSGAAEGCDVLVNALTPPYSRWAREIPRFTQSVIAAAASSGASILLPGNVYNFGPDMPGVLTETTPQLATGTLGRARIEMERTYMAAVAQGVQTLILRAGDFFERAATGNWFDSQITPKLADGIVTYPGLLDSLHSWAYLPDLGRAAAAVAEKRHDLARFETVGYPGHALTGGELVRALEDITGKSLRVKAIPWPLIKALSLFKPDLKGVVEMSYLWRTPHRIDGARFRELLPDFEATPLKVALTEAVSARIAQQTETFKNRELVHGG